MPTIVVWRPAICYGPLFINQVINNREPVYLRAGAKTMISMFPAFPAISADASRRVSSLPRKRSKLAVLCAVLFALLCGAGSIAPAQTAHFSWIQSVLQIPAQSPTMNAVAVDGNGNIYAPSGYFSPYVMKFTPSVAGYTTSPIGTGLGSCNGVAVDGSGNVYIADGTNLVLVKETLSGGSYVQSTVTSLPSNAPTYLWPFTVDGSGNIYIGDTVNNQIIKETLSAGSYTQSTVVNGLQNGINAIAVDQSGNLYYTDQNDRAAVMLTLVAGGYQQSLIGSTDMGVLLNGVAVDQNGNVFMSGAGGGGGMTLGLAYAETLVNGSYVQSILNLGVTRIPYGLSVDAAGNVYIAGTGGVLEESPVSGSFGSVNIGSASAQPISMIFTLDTAGTLGGTAVLTQGATGQDFTDAGSDTCVAGTAYTAGESCTINVTFTPKFAGSRYGAVVLNDNSGNAIATGYLQGTGIGPQINFLPISVLSGNEGKLGGGFSNPSGAAVDGNGNVYVADNGNNAVKKIPPGCTSASCVTTLGGGFNGPVYPAVDGGGNVYVTDSDNNAVKEIPSGCASASCVATLGGGFSIPTGVAVDGSGNVYVTDHSNNAVKKIPPGCASASCVTTLGGGFLYPEGVAVDGSGNVYVLDSSNSPVKEIPLGCVSASCVTTLDGLFNSPAGVAVDGSGNVYIADFFGAAVQEKSANCSSASCVTTLFGGLYPDGVAVDGSGNVYVTDNGNNAVMEINRVTAPSLTFPSTQVNATSAAQTVTITNDGNAPLSFTDITYPAVFPESTSATNDCKTTTSLASNETCTLTVDFTPQAVGALSGSLVLTDNNLNAAAPGYATQSISLSGTGTLAPSFTISAEPTSLSIVQGASGQVGITEVGQNGFAGSITLAASGLPSGVTASFAPTTVAGLIMLTLTANSVPATEGYTVTVTGTSGTLTANTTFFLLLIPGPSITIGASPTSLSIVQGGSGTSGITVTGQNGFLKGNLISLAASGLPAGVTASFTPNPTTGTSVLTLTASSTATLGPATVTVTGTAQTLTASTTLAFTVNPAQSFTLTGPPAVAVLQGATSTSTVQVIPQNGFTGSVQLFLSPLLGVPINSPPPGITASFSPNPTTGTSVLTLTASSAAATGTYTLSVTGTSGSLIEATTIILTVSPAPSFTLSATPPAQGMAPGGYSTSTITVTGQNGFNGSVQLAASGLPSGVTASFAPNLTAGTSVLTLTASSAATLGTTNLVITGTSGSLTEVTILPLTVNSVVVTAPSLSNFGTVNIGTTSPVTPVVFTFVNGGAMGSTAVLTQGATGLDYADAGSDTCTPNTAYTFGQTCTVNVTFTPKFAGTRYGAVVLTDNNGNVLATGYLQGTGVGPQVIYSPALTSTPVSGIGSGSVPVGVAVDGSGNVYVANLSNAVTKIPLGCTSASCVTTLGGGFSVPSGVAVDGSGNVYVADQGNNAVKEIPPGCASASCVATLGGGFSQPVGVAVDGSGNVFVADFDNNAVKEMPSGCASASCVTTLGGGFSYPRGVAVDGSGNVYVGDNYNNAVKEIPSGCASTSCVTTLGGGFNGPEGVAVDGSGNVYVVDTQNGAVKEMPPGCASTNCVTTLGDGFDFPAGVAVDGSGNVYVVDYSNSGLYEIGRATAPSLNFPSTQVNATSATQTVTITNDGNAPLNFTNITYPANFPESASATNDCMTTTSLASNETCTLTIDFTPQAAGALSGSLILTDNNLNAAAPGYAVQTIALSGTSTQITPTITWATPAAITYGTPLSRRQLDATSTIAGTFTYSPAAGTVLTAGQQTLTVTFTPTDTTDYTTATATVTLTVNQATPIVIWFTPRAITYGTPLSASQLDANATAAGTFTYSPAAGTVLNAGTQTLTATFTPTDATDYTTATASVTLTVNKAALTINWATPAAISYGTALSGTQLDASSTAAGSFAYSPAAGTVLAVGNHTLTVTLTATNPTDYTTATATASVTLTVNKATPAITWATPAAITYGTALSATQLDATSTVTGTFKYSPAAGTVLSAGSQTLTATFTPNNTTDYVPATASVALTVNKATPAITWATLKAITYGTALSATQLDASATVAGTFKYSPAADTVLSAGSQTLTATFTPNNTTDYTTSTASVTLTVNKATPAIIWATPKAIIFGTALSATQLNASSTVAGTFTYSPAAGTVLAVGSHTLTATFTPTNATDYTTATDTVTLTVNK
jgi:large repetitive protein